MLQSILGYLSVLTSIILCSRPSLQSYVYVQGWATDQRLTNALIDISTANYKYDTVILQDQSQVAGFHIFGNFQQERINPVIAIDSLIQENGANTMLYMTWGRKNGDTMNTFYPDFKTMNRLLMEG